MDSADLLYSHGLITKLRIMKRQSLLFMMFVGIVLQATRVSAADLTPNIRADYESKADSLEYCFVENFLNKSKGVFWSTPKDVEKSSRYIYWQQAHAMDVIINAYERLMEEGRTEEAASYKTFMNRWYTNHAGNYNGDTWTNPYTDDMAWIGLTIFRMGEVLGKDTYYKMAKSVYATIAKRKKTDEKGVYLPWNTDAGSGANACTLAPSCLLAVKLYEYYGTESYLEDARAYYKYLIDSKITKSDGRVEEPPLTYTQGTLGEAMRHLYHVTGETDFKNKAALYIYYAFTSDRCTSKGLLRHEGTSMDQSIFKAVLIPYAVNFVLDEDMLLARRKSVMKYLQDNADALWRHLDLNRYPQMYCPYYWGENFDYSTTASMGAMTSGASLLEGVTRMNRKLAEAASVLPLSDDTDIHSSSITAYNLAGQVVDSATKGLLIINGKKCFNK